MFGLKGLIVDSAHVDDILAGRKRWEMRARGTRQRGTIALIRKDSGAIVGIAELVDSLGPLNCRELIASQRLHRIARERLDTSDWHKYRYAWVLENARPLTSPVVYRPLSSAVTWVNLRGDFVNRLDTHWVV